MTQELDEFKYQALLVKLESIKGTKKPIHDFIKKIHKLAELDLLNKDNLQTLKYGFMLVTRAMEYNGSLHKIKFSIKRDIDNLARYLLKEGNLELNEISTVYEFYKEKLYFSPYRIKELLYYTQVYEIYPYLNVDPFYINEFKSFSSPKLAAKLIIEQQYPNAKILRNLKDVISTIKQTKQEMQDLCNVFKPILKDSYEHDSTSSEEHY